MNSDELLMVCTQGTHQISSKISHTRSLEGLVSSPTPASVPPYLRGSINAYTIPNWDDVAHPPVPLAWLIRVRSPFMNKLRGGGVSIVKNTALWCNALKRAHSLLKDLGGISREEISRMLSVCLLYTSPSPRDKRQSRMPSSA